MLLKYLYDSKLAHASYLVGCQRAKVGVVVDPGRDIDQYLELAEREGVQIVAVAETHIHADYVSGARELAERVGAKLYISDEGPEQWKYQYVGEYKHQLLHDGDKFMVGNIQFEVLHTPGHTPESISFVLTDQGGGADEPMGIFTGDFVFVGSIGRPDLLEEAAGMVGTAEIGARDLFRSIERFKSLPEYLQIWPAHGAGSACGKGLGAIPSSTVGYEKRFNPALQYEDEEEFVDYILANQPEAPPYFALMKRVNKEGPAILGSGHHHQLLPLADFQKALAEGTVIDLRPSSEVAKKYVPQTLNIPMNMLSAWAGWIVDYDRPVFLMCQPNELEEAARVLHKIGVEHIGGGFDQNALLESGQGDQSYESGTPVELRTEIESNTAMLVDVRSQEEWNEGHIDQAEHHFLGRLPQALSQLPSDRKIIVQCRSGARSAIAVSLLKSAGFDKVVNLTGGYTAWKSAGLPTVKTEPTHSSLT